MSLETRLARVRGLGSAKDGTHHWWAQRLTGVALVPLTVWFAISVASMADGSYADAVAWVGSPVNTILLLLLIASTFHHLQLGIQVVLEDYVHAEGTKIAALMLVKFACAILAVACGYAVLRVAFVGG
ncbi:succinate dehydrogenase, hydrophobic membrane anchor protein [Hwanghaeella sp.]|uniref:succinate dehydrogenase, hydrophobic membrane anchor protein n=1 Tax=Hwanghaeella sp. TaxID=2605943 RepID=UPI003CCBA46C